VFAGYLALQAVMGVVFWIVMASSPAARSWLELDPQRRAVTDAFLAADGLAIVGSALGAWALWAQRRWAIVVVSITLGAVLYPTIYLVSWSAQATTARGSLAVMVPVSMCTGWVTWQTWRLLR
jgi:hypothetical protein